jgi:hypothetical protein
MFRSTLVDSESGESLGAIAFAAIYESAISYRKAAGVRPACRST